MTPFLASLAALAPASESLAVSSDTMARTLPAIAEFEGAHAGSGISLGLVAIAAGFVLAGAWMLLISARPRG
jgi:hypothetical protein